MMTSSRLGWRDFLATEDPKWVIVEVKRLALLGCSVGNPVLLPKYNSVLSAMISNVDVLGLTRANLPAESIWSLSVCRANGSRRFQVHEGSLWSWSDPSQIVTTGSVPRHRPLFGRLRNSVATTADSGSYIEKTLQKRPHSLSDSDFPPLGLLRH